jgi:hypothetical protein
MKGNQMNIIVCGGRDYNDYQQLSNVLNEVIRTIDDKVNIISGMARGADSLAVQYAKEHNIDCIGFPAQWDKYGLSAGYRRNEQMLIEGKPNLVIAFPGGKGTQHMIQITKSHNIPIYII